MKTLGAHWEPIENLVRTHIGNMIGMMVGHPHLQLKVGMCVHPYNLCVCETNNENFLVEFKCVTPRNSLLEIGCNWFILIGCMKVKRILFFG
jgi:hypothetical protein